MNKKIELVTLLQNLSFRKEHLEFKTKLIIQVVLLVEETTNVKELENARFIASIILPREEKEAIVELITSRIKNLEKKQ